MCAFERSPAESSVNVCVSVRVCLFDREVICIPGGGDSNADDGVTRKQDTKTRPCTRHHPATHTFASGAARLRRTKQSSPSSAPPPPGSPSPPTHLAAMSPVHLPPIQKQTHTPPTHLQDRYVCVPRSPLRHAPRATHLRLSIVRPVLRSSNGASAVTPSALSWF